MTDPTNRSWRSRPLPPGWPKTRARILRRDGGICRVCGGPGADQVDHIVPASRWPEGKPGLDADENLGTIHKRPCHEDKSKRESGVFRSSKRPDEPHPGIVHRRTRGGRRA